ncbi:MAG TPA: DnaJ domain-containing protein [candidate division Zixibacteria bacterium]|nr:DnaJ domain-containing protein [candidate division Zixibacteria bacterium]
MYQTLLPYTPERDVYRLLQLEPTASPAEVHAACRRLARRFHPDHNRSPRANEEMQVVNAVRAVMTDPAARAVYDRARARFYHQARRPTDRAPASPGVVVSPALRGVLRPVPAPARPSPPAPRARTGLSIAGLARPAYRALERRARALLEVLEAMVAGLGIPRRCPSCRVPVEADFRYCAWCGASLERPRRLATRRAG